LFPHGSGYWAKKVRQKLHYFGKVADDPKGEAAIQLWLDRKDDLLAGRTPRTAAAGLSVGALCNHFLTAKEQQRDAGDIRTTTFGDYYTSCKFVVGSFGKTRLVVDLAADDFQALRAKLAKRFGPYALSREVQHVRTLFKYGYDAGLIDKPVRFGPLFKRPAKRVLRAHRQKTGGRMFEADVLRTLIDKAGLPLKAMILLGINCGFGNTDCARLPKSALDLSRGWINFPRPKTAVERRCPLWPETIQALKDAIAERPDAKQHAHSKLVFLTKYGQPWVKEDSYDNPVTKEFRKLIDSVDREAATAAKKRQATTPEKIYRYGLGFYALRHTFETVAGDSKDQVSINCIMGHNDDSMAAVYRERINDERLVQVVNLVHRWLFQNKDVE
jgi:integrase